MSIPTASGSAVSIPIEPSSVPISALVVRGGRRICAGTHAYREGCVISIQEHVRLARARFGYYDLIDFVAVLIGYILSGEPTLLAFYERLAPWAEPFMALFGRNRLPHRSTLSRFLAALNQSTVEALRARFHEDMLARKPFSSPGGLVDRRGEQWVVIDVDGTRATARQRALPPAGCLARAPSPV